MSLNPSSNSPPSPGPPHLSHASLFSSDIAPDEPAAERESFQEVLRRLNPRIPADALEEAMRKVTCPESPSLIVNNRAFHHQLIKGIFEKNRFLDLIKHFIVFESDGEKIAKKMAAYHQYHAVNKTVECTVKACSPQGDRKAGVIWHTQGSGKSLAMAFYA